MSSLLRRYLHLNYIRNDAFNTIKSKYDEQLNQPLLKRLKKLSVIGEKRTVPNVDQTYREDATSQINRCLTQEKLKKMIELHTNDALVWNASVLGRIYHIPEYYCRHICRYVKPMVDFASNRDGRVKLVEQKTVIDIARFKEDESYLVTYKRIVFPDTSGQSLPKKALPEYLEDRARERQAETSAEGSALDEYTVEKSTPMLRQPNRPP